MCQVVTVQKENTLQCPLKLIHDELHFIRAVCVRDCLLAIVPEVRKHKPMNVTYRRCQNLYSLFCGENVTNDILRDTKTSSNETRGSN